MSNRRRKDQPSLRMLAFVLRHRELWPAAFQRWDFRQRSQCGIALAQALWPKAIGDLELKTLSVALGLNMQRTMQTFFDPKAYGVPAAQVTPKMVADRIDGYINA